MQTRRVGRIRGRRRLAMAGVLLHLAGAAMLILGTAADAMAAVDVDAAAAESAQAQGSAAASAGSPAPRLDARFSCSAESEQDRQHDGDRRLLADSAEFHLRGDTVESFRWESSLFRSTHGFDCSIDDGDGLETEMLPREDGGNPGNGGGGANNGSEGWRVRLRDGHLARERRGYDADHGFNCSIRLIHAGDTLRVIPSCPALCGSRENFSALTVDLKTGHCDYEH